MGQSAQKQIAFKVCEIKQKSNVDNVSNETWCKKVHTVNIPSQNTQNYQSNSHTESHAEAVQLFVYKQVIEPGTFVERYKY